MEITAEKAAAQALLQMDSWEKYRQPRMSKILTMQNGYYGKFPPQPRGRSNIAMPFFSKYVDELKARIDESPVIKYSHKKASQILIAKKVQSKCEIDRSPSAGDWNRKDRQAKFMGVFSGVICYDYFAESAPKYESTLESVDVFDMACEATGGNDFENHAFVGKMNMFRSKSDIQLMIDEGVYDKKLAGDLIATAAPKYKELQKRYLTRYDRSKALGLDMSGENYIGEEQYILAQWQMTIGGKRYFLVFDQVTGKPVRFQPLKEVYGSNLYSMVLAQTHEDPHTVLCKSPADDIWPVCELLRVMSNYGVDHATKQVWGQTMYDPNFIEANELQWQGPGQMSMARSYMGKPIGEGIHQITTPDKTVVNIDFVKYYESFAASLAGVAPADMSNEQAKVAVMFGNLQKVSARLGVYNKSYSEAWNKIATRYVWGLKENMTEKGMVEVIGEHGVEWQEFAKQELSAKPDFDIEVVGANVELEMGEAAKKKETDAIIAIAGNPILIQQVNPRVIVEELARSSGKKEDAIARLMDVQNYSSTRVIAHASMAVEKILQGKDVDIYRGADEQFMRYIYSFVTENNIEDDVANKLMDYAHQHLEIVFRNEKIKQLGKPQAPQGPASGGTPTGSPPSGGAPAAAPPTGSGAVPGGQGAPPGVVPQQGAVPAMR